MFPPINDADDAVQHAPKVEVKSAEERDRSSLRNELKANARLIRRVENALEVRSGGSFWAAARSPPIDFSGLWFA